MADIYIKLDELETMNTDLKSIVEEFEDAVSNSEALEAAIGDPFYRHELRSKAQDFEERWDIQRDDLKDGLKKIQEHLEGVINSINDADGEMAIRLEPPAQGSQPVSKR